MKRDVRKFDFVCGNDIFHQVDEYRRIEADRLRHLRPLSALLPYVPAITDPVKIICCNIHVFQDANGASNYPDRDCSRFDRMWTWLTNHYQFPEGQSDVYPPAEQLFDSRIRFALNDVRYYQDDNLCTSISIGVLQAAAVARDPTTRQYMNIYITKGAYPAAGMATFPSSSPSFDSWIMLFGAGPPQTNPTWMDADYIRACTLAHEFGHVLDLAHTYSGAICTQGPDFLSDVFGDSPNTCPHAGGWAADPFIQEPLLPNTVITNNLMGGNHDNYWISRLQAGMMHRALTEKSVKRYVATGCKDCASCVAFTVHGVNHVSQGGDAQLTYSHILLNKSWGWSNNMFVVPVSGIYHFDASFVKNAYGNEGVDGDLLMTILNNGTFVGRAWSGGGAGKRGTGCVSLNAQLQRGDIVTTIAQSVDGVKRNFLEYYFSGHLLCGCC